MWKTIFELFFPITCLRCNKPGSLICPSCFRKIPLHKKDSSKSNQTDLDKLVIATYYNNPLVKQMIYRYKYDFIKDLSKPLAKLMIKQLNNSLDLRPEDSLLIPIPLHKKRLKWRGFNQAHLLCLEIGQGLNMLTSDKVLLRVKHSQPQMSIKSSKKRKENIKQVFQINPSFKSDVNNKTIILIDDVSTSGATLEEAAKTLKELRPKQIWGLVIAQG